MTITLKTANKLGAGKKASRNKERLESSDKEMNEVAGRRNVRLREKPLTRPAQLHNAQRGA
jgi:hypothetical protein